MPLHVTTVDRLPLSTRTKKGSLESTDEWLQFKAKMAEGLKPHEAIYITFTPEQLKQLGLKTAGRTFRMMALAYIRKLRLQYDVWRYQSEGKEVIAIAGRPVGGKA